MTECLARPSPHAQGACSRGTGHPGRHGYDWIHPLTGETLRTTWRGSGEDIRVRTQGGKR